MYSNIKNTIRQKTFIQKRIEKKNNIFPFETLFLKNSNLKTYQIYMNFN